MTRTHRVMPLAEQREAFWRRHRSRLLAAPRANDEIAEGLKPLAVRIDSIPPGSGVDCVSIWLGDGAWDLLLTEAEADECDLLRIYQILSTFGLNSKEARG